MKLKGSWLEKASVAAFILLLLLGLLYYLHMERLSKRVEASRQRLRALGCPSSMEEIQREYDSRPRSGINAWDILREASAKADFSMEVKGSRIQLKPEFWQEELDNRSCNGIFFSPADSECRRIVSSFLSQNKESIDILKKLPSANYCKVYERSVSPELYDRAPLDFACNLSILSAAMSSAPQDCEEAAMRIADCLDVLCLLEEPFLEASWSARQNAERMIWSISCLVGTGRLSSQSLNRLSASMSRLRASRSFLYSMKAQILYYDNVFGKDDVGVAKPGLSPYVKPLLCLAGMDRMAHAEMLDEMGMDLKLIQGAPDLESLALLMNERRKAFHKNVPTRRKFYGFLAGMTFDNAMSVKGVVYSWALTMIQLRLAELACAIERFRQAEGRLPGSLYKLAPEYLNEIPRDVFLPKSSFRYVKGDFQFTAVILFDTSIFGCSRTEDFNKSGFKVYSVGWYAGDQGGDDTRDITMAVYYKDAK